MMIHGVGAAVRFERTRCAFGGALREGAADQLDELVGQDKRRVVVCREITKLEGSIPHLGKHTALIRREHLAIVVVDEGTETYPRRATKVDVADRHIGQDALE